MRVNPATGAATTLLNGSNRLTVNGVGTAAYSHETFCVWVEPASGDIIWCDYGGNDGSGTGSIRRRSAATGATSIIFNLTYPFSLTPDATGATWCVRQRAAACGRRAVRALSARAAGTCFTATAKASAPTMSRRMCSPPCS